VLSYPVPPSTGSRRPGLSTQVVLGAGVAAVEKGFCDPDNIAVVDVDGTRAMNFGSSRARPTELASHRTPAPSPDFSVRSATATPQASASRFAPSSSCPDPVGTSSPGMASSQQRLAKERQAGLHRDRHGRLTQGRGLLPRSERRQLGRGSDQAQLRCLGARLVRRHRGAHPGQVVPLVRERHPSSSRSSHRD
jgi:hypothetical protein